MATKIRLARAGNKKRPFYHIVASDVRAPRDGKFLEKLGTYNPLIANDNENRTKLDMDRVNYWLSVGAQPTERVQYLIDIATGKKKPVARTQKPSKKAQEKAKLAKEEAEQASAEETESSDADQAQASEAS